ncbi:methyl-accepting chemotaxis protein [Lysinibacillus sp. OL1]|uniref:methyl-accepting chemotaxis protein n=1 Tax=Lysinibacillus sp. OL1 TaxID=2517243 RepID=UPI00103FB776|nr:HAMP domain-containing methyl-accepting chemotaxis protein [Lysinibacillus sp. OL1]TBV84980.1 methyl-accepting chemotaxis protein [Lysinibacillus sp. OL1]
MESRKATSRNFKGLLHGPRSLRIKMIFVVVFSLLLGLPITAFINFNLGEFFDGRFAVIINATVTLLISTVIISLVTRFIIINRLEKVLDATKTAANGDLTAVIEVGSKDEIGQLASSFNVMINSLSEVVKKTNNTATEVSTYAEGLKVSVEHSSSSVEQISNAVREIVSGSEVQSTKALELLSLSKIMESEMENVDVSVRAVSKVANETSAKADTGLQLIDEMIRKMNLIQESVKDSCDIVNSLGDKSNEISQIVSLITSIAEQTNLLALNASIEAARAGENGKDFAVVADEVRKLAEESAKAGGDIRKLVDEILTQTSNSVKSINKGTDIVEDGRKTVNETGAAFKDIVNYVHNITLQSEDVNKAMIIVSEKTDQTTGIIEEIAAIAEQASSSIQNVAASIEEQSSSNDEIATSAIVLSKTANKLKTEISRFNI